MNGLDWNELRSFYLVAKHGSLSGAARAEGTSQPTMSRHVAQLETQLGQKLFDRAKSGVTLTQAGTELFEHAEKMAASAAQFSLASEGQSSRISGTVRITASRIVSAFMLPSFMAELRLAEPEIDIELVASDETENLLHREADIALRMFRPTQLDVVTRKVAEFPMGAYATHDYIERKGEPTGLGDIHAHDFVGYDRSTVIIDGFRQNGIEVSRDFFAFRSDDQVVCWAMVVAGYGIGFNQRVIGDHDERVKRILTQTDIPSLPVWLTAHGALKTNPRIRRVYDFLAERFAEL